MAFFLIMVHNIFKIDDKEVCMEYLIEWSIGEYDLKVFYSEMEAHAFMNAHPCNEGKKGISNIYKIPYEMLFLRA